MTRWTVFGAPVNNSAVPLNATPVMIDPPEGGWQVARRVFLKGVAGLAGLPLVSRFAAPARSVAVQPLRHVRPGGPGWPGPAEWVKLRQSVGGRLVKVEPPFAACTPDPGSPACTDLFQNLLRNPSTSVTVSP